jgi:two-component system KDP operon response regulator KdpE
MADKPRVLAVDDEAGILRLIRLDLTAQGFDVKTAGDGAQAMRAIEEETPDIVILDVMLPDVNGLDLLRQMRDAGSFPVIMLTAKDRDTDKAEGLNLGADDYLGKPFSPEELSARVHAVLRRQRGAREGGPMLSAGNIRIDLNKRLVYRRDEMVNLTRTEWLLLAQLAERPGKLVLNADLLSQVWGPDYRGDLQYLRVWISRLRKKLEDDPSTPQLIKTVQGVGYVLQVQDANADAPDESADAGLLPEGEDEEEPV